MTVKCGRIASENARMGLIFTQRGLAIEHGSSWMLPRIIGLARATELAITGRLVDANEALELGLVNRVVPADKLMQTVREIASGIATKCSPLGVAQAKKMIYQHLFTDLATAVRDDDTAMEMIGELADLSARSRVNTTAIDFSATERRTKQLIELEDIGCDIQGRPLFKGILSVPKNPGET